MSQIENQPRFYSVDYLATIEVSGDDAGKFLQGQLTLNLHELSETQAGIAAFCNPKGRVISTLLIIKQEASFHIVLPRSLINKVLKKLQMYILRSKVQLRDRSEDLQLIGLYYPLSIENPPAPFDAFAVVFSPYRAVRLPSSATRLLCMIDRDSFAEQRQALTSQGFREGCVDEWRWQDISSAFPWFDEAQSEQYIPQMLNIDKLGGISFNKGCYTGQEIIARTHYLGKAKRQFCLAECSGIISHERDLFVLDAATLEKQGNVLAWQSRDQVTRLLIVLQTVDEPAKPLILDDDHRTAIALIPCQ